MKQGIFVALAALALAFASVPDTTAHAWGGWHNPNLNLKLTGSSFAEDPDDLGDTRSIQTGLVRGKFVRGVFNTETVNGTAGPTPGCDIVGGSVTTNFVVTFHDGSAVSATAQPGSIYCSDGVVFDADFIADIVSGTGRYAGATGTVDVSASISDFIATGTLRFHFD